MINFSVTSLWFNVFYGTFPVPLTFTHRHYHGCWHKPPISNSGKMTSFFYSWKRAGVFQKTEKKKERGQFGKALVPMLTNCQLSSFQSFQWSELFRPCYTSFSGWFVFCCLFVAPLPRHLGWRLETHKFGTTVAVFLWQCSSERKSAWFNSLCSSFHFYQVC